MKSALTQTIPQDSSTGDSSSCKMLKLSIEKIFTNKELNIF